MAIMACTLHLMISMSRIIRPINAPAIVDPLIR